VLTALPGGPAEHLDQVMAVDAEARRRARAWLDGRA
jgi:hypothetical protein